MIVPFEIIDLVAHALGSTPQANRARCRMMLVCRAWSQAVRYNPTHRAGALSILAHDSTHLAGAHSQLELSPQECVECEKTGRLGAAWARVEGLIDASSRGGAWPRDAFISHKAKNMLAKVDRVVEGIIVAAKKTKVTKMYSVSGYHVAKRASRALADLGIANEIVTGEQTRNHLTGIEPGYDSGCCHECDGKVRFYTNKVPVVYVRVLKNA